MSLNIFPCWPTCCICGCEFGRGRIRSLPVFRRIFVNRISPKENPSFKRSCVGSCKSNFGQARVKKMPKNFYHSLHDWKHVQIHSCCASNIRKITKPDSLVAQLKSKSKVSKDWKNGRSVKTGVFKETKCTILFLEQKTTHFWSVSTIKEHVFFLEFRV